MARGDPQILLRLPCDLKDKLTDLADKNKRSVNAEVIAAIEQVLSSTPSSRDNKTAEEVSEILERVKHIEKQIKDK